MTRLAALAEAEAQDDQQEHGEAEEGRLVEVER